MKDPITLPREDGPPARNVPLTPFERAKVPHPVDDPRALVPFGWAPGGYFCHECPDCKEPFTDSDKRSSRCQECAERLRDSAPAGDGDPSCDARQSLASAPQDDDETYEIGKRDGYEKAVQDLDLATGGDGEFFASTSPGESVDVPAMFKRIVDRASAPQVGGELREKIARIVDPDVWRRRDGQHDKIASLLHFGAATEAEAEQLRQSANAYTTRSLAKADEILALAALSQEAEPVAWRPIETAPTDGTKFDAWCVHPDPGVHIGVRFTDVQMRGDKSGFGYVVHCGDKTVWQYLDAREPGAGFPAWKATHWRRIPAAPDDRGGEVRG